MPALYTAVATAIGEGRSSGHAETDDGKVKADLGYPKEMGGDGKGTNPEQLVSTGYAACFLSALRAVAGQKKLVLKDPKVTVRATLSKNGDNFDLSFEIDAALPGVPTDEAEALVQTAHGVCPYSRAFTHTAPTVAKLIA
jgi:Ohr subfamily peroxiredoxin